MSPYTHSPAYQNLIELIHTHLNINGTAFGSELGFSILPEDTSTWGLRSWGVNRRSSKWWMTCSTWATATPKSPLTWTTDVYTPPPFRRQIEGHISRHLTISSNTADHLHRLVSSAVSMTKWTEDSVSTTVPPSRSKFYCPNITQAAKKRMLTAVSAITPLGLLDLCALERCLHMDESRPEWLTNDLLISAGRGTVFHWAQSQWDERWWQ